MTTPNVPMFRHRNIHNNNTINNNADNGRNETTNMNTTAFPAPVAADIVAKPSTFKTISNGTRTTVGKLPYPVTTGDQALQLAGLDWTVSYQSLADLAPSMSDSTRAANLGFIVRDDISEPLGSSVTAGYSHQQNSVLGDLGEQVIRGFGGKFTNALVKGLGDTVALTVALPQSVKLGRGRKLCKNITIMKGHGGAGAIQAIAHDVDFFCTNQIVSMMRDGVNMVRIQHTTSADGRIKLAHHEINTLLNAQDEFHQSLVELLDEPATLNQWLPIVMPRPERRANQTAAQYQTTLRKYDRKLGVVCREYKRDFNDNITGTKLGVLWAFQGAEQHYNWAGTARTHDAQVGRFLSHTQPVANRAYAALTA
jgi:hypothetical protein